MKYLLVLIVLVLGGCAVKDYERTQTKIITMKSPKIKFSDAGYLRNSDESVELELFMAGVCIEKIAVNRLICTSAGCMSKSGFNQDYLNEAYPSDIMQNLLLGRPIYEGMNLIRTPGGFEQRISDESVDIIYRVGDGEVYFKDIRNSILFKMKDINE